MRQSQLVPPANKLRSGSRRTLHTQGTKVTVSNRKHRVTQTLCKFTLWVSTCHTRGVEKVLSNFKQNPILYTGCKALHKRLHHTSAHLIHPRHTSFYSLHVPSSFPPLGLCSCCSFHLKCLSLDLTQLPPLDFQLFGKAAWPLLFNVCAYRRATFTPAPLYPHPAMPSQLHLALPEILTYVNVGLVVCVPILELKTRTIRDLFSLGYFFLSSVCNSAGHIVVLNKCPSSE